MPVPAEQQPPQPPVRRRPQMSSRTCSYQDTSRYRFSWPDRTGLARQNSRESLSDSPESLPSHVVAPAAVAPPAPAPPPVRPILSRGSTRESWHGPTPSPGIAPGRQSPFVPGFFMPPGSGSNSPAQTPGAHGLPGPAASLWGPASPSLAGNFTFEQDLKSAAESTVTNTPSTPAIQTFAFTVHADRNLSALSRPGTPTDDAGEPIPISVTEAAAIHQQGHDVAATIPATGRKVMVAVDAADPAGLRTLDWACKKVVQPGDTLVIVRVVREQKGFKGGYAAASEMARTIESRAREEADRITCHALRQLGQEGKKCVDLFVKYRVGEPRACIRELVRSEGPGVLIVGNGTNRVAKGSTGSGTIFFHGGKGTFVPDGWEGEFVSAQ